MIGLGTILNALGILLGGIAGLAWRKQPEHTQQMLIKGLLGILTVIVGLKLTWSGLGGGLWPVLKQMTILVLALILGRITGRLLHLQKGLNRLGQFAKEKMTQAGEGQRPRWGDGFLTCAVLFCLTPLAVVGSVLDGVLGHWPALGIKAVMDGLATLAFVTTFGGGALLSVLPVVAYQGAMTLAARWLAPWLGQMGLLDSVSATGGMLVFCVALIILELKKVELADYLPSLFFAPLLTWLWR